MFYAAYYKTSLTLTQLNRNQPLMIMSYQREHHCASLILQHQKTIPCIYLWHLQMKGYKLSFSGNPNIVQSFDISV